LLALEVRERWQFKRVGEVLHFGREGSGSFDGKTTLKFATAEPFCLLKLARERVACFIANFGRRAQCQIAAIR
jgi:hypothetical protein